MASCILFFEICFRKSGFSMRKIIFSASLCGFLSTKNPFILSVNNSGIPPALVVRIVFPRLIASRIAIENPSVSDSNVRQSQDDRSLRYSLC